MKRFKRILVKKKLSRLFSKKYFSVTKREKFVTTVFFLTSGLFIAEHLLGRSGFFVTIFLSVASVLLFFFCMYKDLKGNMSVQVFILPFLYTLSFGSFYFLAPSRFLTRTILTTVYGIGLYSLFLSHNIFVVASIRTIALVSGARIVSFAITLLSYFFLSKVVFTLNFPIYAKLLLLLTFSYLFILQSLWTVTLEKSLRKNTLWILALTACLIELFLALWFWPTTSTFVAIFFTGFFYTIVGLSHAWFDKRLFKGVMWEYIWVGAFVVGILILFTSWRG